MIERKTLCVWREGIVHLIKVFFIESIFRIHLVFQLSLIVDIGNNNSNIQYNNNGSIYIIVIKEICSYNFIEA